MDANTTPAPSGEYVRRSDGRDLVALDIAANASGLHAMGAFGRVVIDLASCERALAAAHTRIADQSTTIEAAFRAKCEAERALEAARAERDALKAQLDPESVQHWDAMRAERDALKVDNERLLGDIDDAQSYLSDIVSPVTGPDGDCPEDLPLRVDEMAEGAVRFFKQAVSERDAARAEVERLRAENYWDLIEQMREAWGQHYNTVGRVELDAFLSSRAVHRPTTTLRARVAELEAAVRDLHLRMEDRVDSDGNRATFATFAGLVRETLITPATAAVLRSVVETKEKKP